MADKSPLIYQKIIDVMAKVPAIGKEKRNAQQGFSYRGIDDVQNALQNILPSVGVFYVPEVLESHREERQTGRGGNLIYTVLKVRYTFYAADGSSVTAVVQSEGMDSGDKSSNKAMSAACKYALFQVFNIATQELQDPDAETPEESQPKAQVKPAPAPKFDEAKFLESFPGLKEGDFEPITPQNAAKVVDREGVPYGLIQTEELRFRLNSMYSSLKKNHLSPEDRHQLLFKLGVVNALLLDRKANHGKAA